MKKFFVLLLVYVIAVPGFAAPAKITRVRLSNTKNQVRFVFDVSRPAHYKHFYLTKPDRLVVDITDATMQSEIHLTKKISTSTSIKDVRESRHKQGFLRVVFDLKHKMKSKVFTLKHPNRLVVDFIKDQQLTPVVTFPTHKKLRNIVVVIDPGHGGKDPGATGPNGHHEKAVVLAIAKDLYRKINREPGFTAKLTRQGDHFVSLWNRLAIARRDHADMFVAIHADAFKDPDANGASVYALSERGATSTAAKWLAERENRSELIGGVKLGDKDKMLRSVLINLSQNHIIAESLQIGSAMLRQLSRLTILHYDKVEQAAFVVLKSPDIPSLLVETGFITNPKEERRLTNSHYQRRLAYALALGIKDYFIHHPPTGTHVAAKENNH